MILYGFDWGPYPRRILIYLHEKGILDVERVFIDIGTGQNREDWFLKINPAGTVPVLQTDSGFHIRETHAILEFLEEIHPDPPLIGTTAEERARTRDQLNLVNIAYAFGNTYLAQLSPLLAGRVTQSQGAAIAMHEEFDRHLAALESVAGHDPYMGGQSPKLADIAFFATAQYYDLFYKVAFPARYTRLKAIYDRFAGRPSAQPPIYPEAFARLVPIPQSAFPSDARVAGEASDQATADQKPEGALR